jgi:hypothetical protein
MSKGKYLTDLYKSIDNKLFNVEEAVKLIVEKKIKNFYEKIYISMYL